MQGRRLLGGRSSGAWSSRSSSHLESARQVKLENEIEYRRDFLSSRALALDLEGSNVSDGSDVVGEKQDRGNSVEGRDDC